MSKFINYEESISNGGSEENKKRNNWWVWLIVAILVVAVVILLVLVLKKDDNEEIDDSETYNNISTSEDISTYEDTSTREDISTSENIIIKEDTKVEEVKKQETKTETKTESNNIEESVKSTFTEKVFKTSENINLKYYLYTPENPKDNMGLIIYLHGGSSKGNDLNLLLKDGFAKYLKDGDLGNVNAYIIIPQLNSKYKGWTDIKVSIRDLIVNVRKTYNISSNKISLTGHSMGGKGTYDLALAYPNLFSCIVPMSGSINVNDENINTLKNISIWAFVGESDTIVDPSTSINLINELKEDGSNAKITIFENASHFDVPELGYKNSDTINYLVSCSK